jgi:hypothetical protein
MSKAELLRHMRDARTEWDAVVQQIPDEAMDEPGVEGHWSAKDVLTHCMAYERWTAALINSDLRGTEATIHETWAVESVPVDMPATQRDDYHAFNEVVRDLYQSWSPARVRESARAAHDELYAAVEAVSEEDLEDPNRFAWTGGRTLLFVMPYETPIHYGKHLPALRAFVEKRER